MKIAGIALAFLMLIGSAFVGVLGSNKSMDLSSKIEKFSQGMDDKQVEAAGFPSAGRLKFGGIVGMLSALGAVGLLVVTFIKKDKVIPVAGAAVALGLIAFLLYPSIETGPTDGMAPKTQAIVAMVLLGIGAAGAFMAKKAHDKA